MVMKLSVRLQTYNHEDFIEACLNGVAIQKTDFVFEVIIGDDFSTDKTKEKIKIFLENNKQKNIKWKLLPREKGDDYHKRRIHNGRLENFVDTLYHCNGQYIALLDGDDYWTDPLKLQKQIDFLESNSEYSICFHHCYKLEGDNMTKIVQSGKFDFTFKDYLDKHKNGLHAPTTLSIVCRNNYCVNRELYELKNNPSGLDYPFVLLHLTKGDGYILQDYCGVYRIHAGGISNVITGRVDLKFLQVLSIYQLKFFNANLRILIRDQLSKLAINVFLSGLAFGSFKLFYFSLLYAFHRLLRKLSFQISTEY